jgi:hypothetical protein
MPRRDAIYGRVPAAVDESLTPESLSVVSDAALRAAGPGARPIVTAEWEKHV